MTPMQPKPPQPAQVQAQPANAAAQFDPLRRRLTQRFQTQQQDQDDALKRRMAQLGNLNSGAAIKLQQQGAEQIANAREEAISNLDAQQIQQQTQLDEAQRGRDFQRGMFDVEQGFKEKSFDRTFGLDEKTKLAGLDLAQKEMDLKRLEQEFNMGGNLADRGYGVDLTSLVPGNFRDAHTGRLINPGGKGLAYEENQGMYNQSNDVIKRRMEQEYIDKLAMELAQRRW